jgi:hypothetical protein
MYRRISLEKQDGERQKNSISRWLERHGVSVEDDFAVRGRELGTA